jgi:hypothetical protein
MGIPAAGLETPGPMRIGMKTQIAARSQGMARSSDRAAVLTTGHLARFSPIHSE